MLKLIGKIIAILICVLVLSSCAKKKETVAPPTEEGVTPPAVGTPTEEAEVEEEEVGTPTEEQVPPEKTPAE